jgi:hypothetical protein
MGVAVDLSAVSSAVDYGWSHTGRVGAAVPKGYNNNNNDDGELRRAAVGRTARVR